MTKTALAELPDWMRNYKSETMEDMNKGGVIAHVSFAAGYAIGQAMKIDDMQKKLDEMTEMLEIARAYQREKDAQTLASEGMHATAGMLREKPL